MIEEGSDKRVGIAAYARSIASALEQRGVDAAQVFERAGVPMYNTTDPLRRMTNREISALFRESVAITSDPYFGLFVASTLHDDLRSYDLVTPSWRDMIADHLPSA